MVPFASWIVLMFDCALVYRGEILTLGCCFSSVSNGRLPSGAGSAFRTGTVSPGRAAEEPRHVGECELLSSDHNREISMGLPLRVCPFTLRLLRRVVTLLIVGYVR